MISIHSSFFILAVTMVVKASDSKRELFKESNVEFATKLFKGVSEGVKDNLLISPLSLNYALTAISTAAEGKTEKEIKDVLQLPGNVNEIKTSYKILTDLLRKDKQLSMATKFFIDKQLKLKKEFSTGLTEYFDAEIDELEFSQQPEPSRLIINAFVENKTNHLIKNLLSPGDVNEGTAAVLINAIYFKSVWVHPFNKNVTKKQTFYGHNKDYVTDMMFLEKKKLQYAESKELKVQLLILPYEGDYQFLIIVPNEKKGLTDVENKIKTNEVTFKSLLELFENTKETLVNVVLPKFEFSQSFYLKDTLYKLGMKDMFQTTANFSKISDQVYVENVIQKTFVSVNEEGTEAAAATAELFGTLSALHIEVLPEPIEVKADRPFVYIIAHKQTNIPLFIGKYTNPA